MHLTVEKWDEMSKRHREERRLIIEYCKAHRMTQREAAAFLQTSEANLSKYLRRNKIQWHTKKRKQERTITQLSNNYPRRNGKPRDPQS